MSSKAIGTLILTVIVFIFAFWLFFAGTVSVGTGQIAVLSRFGKVTGQELGEGFHFKNPLDKANTYDIKVLKEQTTAESASRDLQDVSATLVVNYRVEAGKVSEIHRTVGNLYKEKLIDPAIQEAFKASTAKYNVTELITDRPAVKKDAYEVLRDKLEKYGIFVQDLSIIDFKLSKEFTQSIEAKQVAAQNAERAKYNLEQAKLDAQAQEVQKTSLSELLLRKQAIEKWNGKLPEYVGGGDSVFNIPLR